MHLVEWNWNKQSKVIQSKGCHFHCPICVCNGTRERKLLYRVAPTLSPTLYSMTHWKWVHVSQPITRKSSSCSVKWIRSWLVGSWFKWCSVRSILINHILLTSMADLSYCRNYSSTSICNYSLMRHLVISLIVNLEVKLGLKCLS